MSQFPYLVEAGSQTNAAAWLSAQASSIDAELDRHAAIVLRGFTVADETAFQECVAAFSGGGLDYIYRSTPRTTVGTGIYTATEYPAGLTIPQHCENAYQREWPRHLLFYCMQPAQGGLGQTTLARTERVTERIDPAIRQRFKERGVMYVRNYRANIDLPWQTVFQTSSRDEVERFCAGHDIQFEWTGPDALRTRQVCHSFATHPRTGATVWFNQAHLFHPSSLDPRTRAAMREMFDEADFPRNAMYGDGGAIDEADFAHIRAAFETETVDVGWRAGDVLIVDNMLASHGRTPYKGPRRVLVAMCNPYSAPMQHASGSPNA